MLRLTSTVAVALLAAAALGWLVLTVAFRAGYDPVLDVVRRLNRRVTNPRQLRSAGRPGSYASVVRHVGRVTGTPYRTPVVVEELDGRFVVALPYGPGADWVRNVLAAGTAVVEHEGRTVPVDRPRLVPAAETATAFLPRERRMQRLYGVGHVLVLRPATPAPAT